jgi:hypothetical protein
MQNIKPSDMTKLEEFSLWLTANGEHASNPNLVETGYPPVSVLTSEAENIIDRQACSHD